MSTSKLGTAKKSYIDVIKPILQTEWTFYLIISILLSSGFSLTISHLTIWDSRLLLHMGIMTAFSLLFACFYFKKLIGFFIALITVGSLLVIINLSGELALWFTTEVPDYFYRMYHSGGALSMTEIFTISDYILQFFMMFGLFSLTYAIVKRFSSFFIHLSLCIIIFSFCYSLNNEIPLTGLALSACGLMGLFPELYHRFLKGTLQKTAIQKTALVIAIFSTTVAYMLIPADTSEWKSQFMSNTAEDFQAFINGPFSEKSSYYSNFSLYQTGFGTDEERLGGNAVLNNKQVLSLDSSKPPTYLKGTVKDYYTGHNWIDSQYNGDFRYDSPFWKKYQREALQESIPADDEDIQRLYNKITEVSTYQLSYKTNDYMTVFVGGPVSSMVMLQRLAKENLYYNMQGEFFTHGRIAANNSIQLTSCSVSRKQADFDDDMKLLETLVSEYPDDIYQKNLQKYTEVPENLPQNIWNTALSITSDDDSAYQKALKIEKWLGTYAEYTLEPGDVLEEVDFLEHFLDQKAGYCTYFATAMAVFAKCNDLPARYVEGYYVLGDPAYKNRYDITNEMAHAWTEIYFYGIGWVEFDPLRWNVDAVEYVNLNESEEQQTSEDSYADEEDAVIEEGSSDVEKHTDNKNLLIFAALAIIFILLLFIIMKILPAVLVRRFKKHITWEYLVKTVADNKAIGYKYYEIIIFLLSCLQLEPRPGETHKIFFERIDRYLELNLPITELYTSVVDLHFGDITPDEYQLKQYETFSKELLDLVISKVGYRFLFKL